MSILITGDTHGTFDIRKVIKGGAYSIDKMTRSEGIDWFPEEIPSKEEYQEGMDKLEQVNFKVDYIIIHTAPTDVVSELVFGLVDDDLELRQYLQRGSEWTEFSAWYLGNSQRNQVFHISPTRRK